MILARVIGNAVATIKHPAYEGKSIMVLQPVDVDTHTPIGKEFLSVDSVQAGAGDLVMASREYGKTNSRNKQGSVSFCHRWYC